MASLTTDDLRAERAEAAYWATYARNIPTTDDTRDTGAVPVAGGYAICLQGSTLEYGLGVGSARALRVDDLQIVDEFYTSRGLPSQLELHPHVAQRDAALLTEWGYRPDGSTTVLEREIGRDVPAPQLAVDILTGRKAEWVELTVAATDHGDVAPERIRRTAGVCAHAASGLVGVRIDGVLAAVGAVGVTGDVALILAAATLPAFRGRGAYGAVIYGLLGSARSRGATVAYAAVPADSVASVAGAVSAGFRPIYTRTRHRKDPSAPLGTSAAVSP